MAVWSCSPRHSWSRARIRILLTPPVFQTRIYKEEIDKGDQFYLGGGPPGPRDGPPGGSHFDKAVVAVVL